LKDRAAADRLAEGMIKAGVPGQPSGYFPAFRENRLTGEKVKKLLFGSKITGIYLHNHSIADGINLKDGQQWWVDLKTNGEVTWRGPSGIDNGKSRIEGNTICAQYQKNWWGLEYCGTVFRNPRGTPEGKDEYFFCNDYGFDPFSMVK